jgi:uncharacterized protein
MANTTLVISRYYHTRSLVIFTNKCIYIYLSKQLFQSSLKNMYIVSLYSGIFGLFFVALSVRTLLLRRQFGIGIGSQDNSILTRAIRVHANFAEYIPLALILIYLLETQTSSNLWIHFICIALLTGRISHGYGVSQVQENFRYRVIGMALTFMVIISTSVRLIIGYIQSVG